MEPNPYETPSELGFSAPPVAAYEEYGGLRWGQSFWNAANATVPFAHLRITSGCLEIKLNAWPLFTDQFAFKPTDVSVMSLRRGWFSSGVRIEHTNAGYPPFILIWSLSCSRILAAAKCAGFPVAE